MKNNLCLILPLVLLVTVCEALKQTDLEIQVNQCQFRFLPLTNEYVGR